MPLKIRLTSDQERYVLGQAERYMLSPDEYATRKLLDTLIEPDYGVIPSFISTSHEEPILAGEAGVLKYEQMQQSLKAAGADIDQFAFLEEELKRDSLYLSREEDI